MKNFFANFRLVTTFTLVVFCMCFCSTGDAAVKDPAAIAKIMSSVDAMQKADIKNFRLNITGKLDTDIVDGTMNTEVDYYDAGKDNLVVKGLFSAVVGKGVDAENYDYPFYIVNDKNGAVVYYQEKGEWFKDVDTISSDKDKKTKQEPKTASADLNLDLNIENLADTLNIVKGVEFGDNASGLQNYVVTLDGQMVASAMQEALKKKAGAKKDDSLFSDGTLSALNQMKDLEVIIAIDNRSNFVQEVKLDLSEPLVILGTATLNEMKSLEPSVKEVFAPLIQTAKFTVSVDGSNYNKLAPITVPSDIVKNAKLAPKDDKKAKELKVTVNEAEE